MEKKGFSPKKSGIEELTRIQKDIPRTSLIPGLKKVEQGDLNKDDSSIKELAELKREINAHVAFSIQEVWNGIYSGTGEVIFPGFFQEVKKYSPGLGHISLLDFQKVGTPETIRAQTFKRTSVSASVEYLRMLTETALTEHLLKWYKFHTERLALLDSTEYITSDRAFQRYELIINNRKRIEPFFSMFETIPSQIEAGIMTAMDTIWDILRFIPQMYFDKFHKRITREELSEIARNSRSLVFQIASTELGVFAQFREKAKKDKYEHFYLKEENGELSVGFADTATENIRLLNPQDFLRTGCPALVAKGSDGKSMLFEFHDWLMEFAEEFYVSRIDQLRLQGEKR